MAQPFLELARSIANSSAHDVAVDLLRTVPGLPPIMQTFHLLSIAAVLGSTVLISLRTLGWAAGNQTPSEMAQRFAPWTWSALPVLFVSGMIFVLARPQRYFTNPVFGIKFALLVPALILAVLLYRTLQSNSSISGSARLLAVMNLIAWSGVVLAGRWIAYADYLFPPE
ncbi:MAG TPA: DUF6644 family protein [Steroidobacteraceae bacterium]|nr:DUF6644 family protein [Steroidobacteraceae bacterium]